MTTSNSPLRALQAQADKIAATLKAVSRGEKVAADPLGRLAASLERGSVKFGVVMDDKIITVDMPWATIREADEAGISAWIVDYMRGQKQTVQ